MVSSILVKHSLLYGTKEGCYKWLKNEISKISRVKMAIRNYFTPWRIKMFLPVIITPLPQSSWMGIILVQPSYGTLYMVVALL